MDMRQISKNHQASRPCREEAKNSFLCQTENENDTSVCQDFIDSYNACLSKFVCK